MSDRIDYGMLATWEGQNLVAYVPDGGSRSGVTVGMGFDLGQRDERDLRRANLDAETFAALRPFLGRTGQAATRALEAYNRLYGTLRISPQAAARLAETGKRELIAPMIRRYDGAIGRDKPRFADLPGEIQTVIASVTWQYGNPASETPRFWKAAVAQDWAAVLAELRNFGDAHTTRRRSEADHMEKAVRRLADLKRAPAR